MELGMNQVVVFENGYKADRSEAVWDRKHQSFCIPTDEYDEEGRRIMLYSTNVIDKPVKGKRRFVPSSKNCNMQIYPVGETEKAYQITDGTNGKIGHSKEYYKYIAKSICWKDENGNVFAPMWA